MHIPLQMWTSWQLWRVDRTSVTLSVVEGELSYKMGNAQDTEQVSDKDGKIMSFITFPFLNVISFRMKNQVFTKMISHFNTLLFVCTIYDKKMN